MYCTAHDVVVQYESHSPCNFGQVGVSCGHCGVTGKDIHNTAARCDYRSHRSLPVIAQDREADTGVRQAAWQHQQRRTSWHFNESYSTENKTETRDTLPILREASSSSYELHTIWHRQAQYQNRNSGVRKISTVSSSIPGIFVRVPQRTRQCRTKNRYATLVCVSS
jgi:hypothetical protein